MGGFKRACVWRDVDVVGAEWLMWLLVDVSHASSQLVLAIAAIDSVKADTPRKIAIPRTAGTTGTSAGKRRRHDAAQRTPSTTHKR